jgi:hypothetical protein
MLLLGCPGVLDFPGGVSITTNYPDKCDDERDKLYTPKLACSLPALVYTQTLSPFPLTFFVGLQRDSSPYFLSVLKERKKRLIQSL